MAAKLTRTADPADSNQTGIADSKPSSLLRTVLSPTAPFAETGGMSPEGSTAASADVNGGDEKAGEANGKAISTVQPMDDTGNVCSGNGQSPLATTGNDNNDRGHGSPNQLGDDSGSVCTDGDQAPVMTADSDSNDSSSNGSDSDIDSCGDNSDGDDNQLSLATGGSNAKDDTVDNFTAVEIEDDAAASGNEVYDDSSDDEPSLVPRPTSVAATRVCGYNLRKRTAEQLGTMRPVKRARQPATNVEVGEIECIDDRRGSADRREYRVQWCDDSDGVWLPRDHLVEDGNAHLVDTFDTYLERYPDRSLTFQAFISRNARAFAAIADGDDNSCVPHALQMALELLGHQEHSARLPSIWAEYLESAAASNISLSDGFHKTSEIVRYCAKGVIKCGVEINVKKLKTNIYDGEGAGPMAIVTRVLPNAKGVRVLPPGVYIVGAFKRNMRAHCFAMEVKDNEDVVVREEGVDSGIGDQRWLRMIKFIRKVEVHKVTP